MIKILKLASGDMIIADVTDDGGNTVEISEPDTLEIIPTEEGLVHFPAPFIFSALTVGEDKFSIDKDHIIFMREAIEEVRHQYAKSHSKIIDTSDRDFIL